jgi:hypothetical protein
MSNDAPPAGETPGSVKPFTCERFKSRPPLLTPPQSLDNFGLPDGQCARGDITMSNPAVAPSPPPNELEGSSVTGTSSTGAGPGSGASKIPVEPLWWREFNKVAQLVFGLPILLVVMIIISNWIVSRIMLHDEHTAVRDKLNMKYLDLALEPKTTCAERMRILGYLAVVLDSPEQAWAKSALPAKTDRICKDTDP